MPNSFRYNYTIGLHDTDAAGVVFAANLIRICHHGYEAFMESIGYGIGSVLKQKKMGLPIVHIEGDFTKFNVVGDRVTIEVRVAEIGTSSFRIIYELIGDNGDCHASAATVHVCIDPCTLRPMELPADFRAALEKCL
jgi:1,4-dihydroxy-2-naphthoyl-CoA hydrolase